MPFYQVVHSYPLTGPQKLSLASAITKLHSTTFLTPSHFVHVTYQSADPSSGNYFMAGKPITNATNRIIATVRVGPSRTKEDYDQLAAKIEDAWKDVLNGPVIDTDGKDQGKREFDVDATEVQIKAKNLSLVAFTPLVTVRENGHAIPAAGQDVAWFKEMLPEFQRRADSGDELYKEVLEEIRGREDFQKAFAASGGGIAGWFSGSK